MTDELKGCWRHQGNNEEQLLLFVDDYYTHTVYTEAEKKFKETRGGTYTVNKNVLHITIEFDTADNEQTGQSLAYSFSLNAENLIMHLNGKEIIFNQIDDGSSSLTGVWHITAQMRQGNIVPIHKTGTRKTLKIISASRFQWVAIDPATKEFFGTGGGIYQFTNGKYTEQIEFFSRDDSRVGASLSFNGKLENGEWYHSGFSSKGEAIYEVWSRV